jgi:hypothetical protein
MRKKRKKLPRKEDNPSPNISVAHNAIAERGNMIVAAGNISTVQTKRNTLAISVTMLFLIVLGATAGIRLAFPGGSLQLQQPNSATTK